MCVQNFIAMHPVVEILLSLLNLFKLCQWWIFWQCSCCAWIILAGENWLMQINSHSDLQYQHLSKTNTQVYTTCFPHQLLADIGRVEIRVLTVTNICFLRDCCACCLCLLLDLFEFHSELHLCVGFSLKSFDKSLLPEWEQETTGQTQTSTPAESSRFTPLQKVQLPQTEVETAQEIFGIFPLTH